MKHLAIALLALVIATPALSGIIFEDHFDSDSLSDYSQICDVGASAAWQVSNGVLRGEVFSGLACYLTIGNPTWDISSAHIRMKGIEGCDKGINFVNTTTNGWLAVNVRSGGHGVMLSYNQSDWNINPDVIPLATSNGEWIDLEVRIVGSTMQVYINNAFFAAREIHNPSAVLPLNEVRILGYRGCGVSVNDYDDIVVLGNGVVAVDDTSWGALKATYR